MERLKGCDFPNLAGSGFRVTSPYDVDYNCAAWAADDRLWWEPNDVRGFWPDGVPLDTKAESFVRAFESIDYKRCADSTFEAGFQKVAIYVDDSGVFAHAARQIHAGLWASKMGPYEDIEHPSLNDLSGRDFGRPQLFLKRATSVGPSVPAPTADSPPSEPTPNAPQG